MGRTKKGEKRPEEPFVLQASSTQACSSTQTHFDADFFCDVGDKGCTDGPLEQIAHLARCLSGRQTLQVRSTNPSVAHDLPAWCRLTGYELLHQDGDCYVIGRPQKET